MVDNVNHPKHYETGPFECIELSSRFSFAVAAFVLGVSTMATTFTVVLMRAHEDDREILDRRTLENIGWEELDDMECTLCPDCANKEE